MRQQLLSLKQTPSSSLNLLVILVVTIDSQELQSIVHYSNKRLELRSDITIFYVSALDVVYFDAVIALHFIELSMYQTHPTISYLVALLASFQDT